MNRRSLLGVASLSVMSTPRRPDQITDPPGAVVAPGSQTGVFRGRLVIIKGTGPPGSGLFVYDAAGVLIGSIAATNGTGPLGGTVKKTITAYQDAGGGSQGVYASLDQGALMASSLNPATTIAAAGVVEVGDAVTAAGQPNMGIFSPTTSALGQSQVVCWAESQDASNTAFIELLGKQTLVHVSGVPAFTTSALLEVQGAEAITAGGLAVTGGTLSDTLEVSGATDLDGTLDVASTSLFNDQAAISAARAGGQLLKVTNTTSAPTSPNIQIIDAADADRTIGVQVTGDTLNRWTMDSNGKQAWGTGSAAANTTLSLNAAGSLQTVSALDSNTYDIQRLTQITAAQGPFTTGSFVPLTGLSFSAAANQSYAIDAMIPFTTAAAAGAAQFLISASAGVVTGFLSAEFGTTGGAVTMPSRTASVSSAMVSPAFAGAATLVLWIKASIQTTIAATITLQAADTIAGDNFSVLAGGWFNIMPAVNTT